MDTLALLSECLLVAEVLEGSAASLLEVLWEVCGALVLSAAEVAASGLLLLLAVAKVLALIDLLALVSL